MGKGRLKYDEEIKRKEEVFSLSQEKGLNDRQISEILGVHRVTVTDIRSRHSIPSCNLSNRQDKEDICSVCGKITLIRRRERRRHICSECSSMRS